ncbi:MAG TPA: hypothetical protein VHE57_09240 [Mycobacteriales bacterium]|nr:hypothetical protein [Mycobacteriales bacterium]
MHPARTRRTTTLAIAALAVTASAIGAATPALADPPPGHGNGNPPSAPPGQVKKTATPSPATSPVATPAPTHVPPGQAKKTSPTTHPGNGNQTHPGNGNSNANKGTHVPPGQANKSGSGTGHAPTGHNPPGNNGTVKIHAVPGDPGHHNVPHPGCSFVVDFWGFDAGQTLTVSFTGQAPTGAGTPLTLSGSGTSVTSPDDAGGGNDPDGELVFTPTASELSVLGAPAKQGYHVRLTVATGQGGGKKQKVFWISPCAPDTSASPTPTPSDTPTLSTDTPTVRSAGGGTLHAARNVPVASSPVLDTAPVTRASSSRIKQASQPLDSLPFTGANLSTLIASGVLALLAGTAITAATRRRRRKIG